MAESDWREAIKWGVALQGVIDLEREERTYKVEQGAALARVRAKVEAEAPGWPKELLKALTSNLVYYMTRNRFGDVLAKDPAGVRKQLLALWEAEDKPKALAELDKYLHAANPELRIGAVLTVGSVLLMAEDATTYPPYQTEVIRKFASLVGEDVPDAYDPRARYSEFLALMDAFIDRARGTELVLRDRLDAQSGMYVIARSAPADLRDPARAAAFAGWRDGASPVVEPVTRKTGIAPEIERAAWAVLDPGLAGGTSALAPDVTAWTSSAAQELKERIFSDLDGNQGTFMERFERQLHGARDEVVVLAAELVYLQALPLSNIRPETKVERLERVLGWASPPRKLPAEFRKALSIPGCFNGGSGFNIQLWNHIAWLATFVDHWASQGQPARTEALSDPWLFRREVVAADESYPAMRFSLQYMAWPNVFMNVVNRQHRLRIRDAYVNVIGSARGRDDESVERDLYEIRQVLEDQHGGPFDWYEPPYGDRWWTIDQRRAWFVRASGEREGLASEWFGTGTVSVSASHLADLAPDASPEVIAQAVDAAYSHLDYAERNAYIAKYQAFLGKMREEDLVVTVVGGELHLGLVESAAAYGPGPTDGLRRAVAWVEETRNLADVPAGLRSALDSPASIVDLTAQLAAIEALWVTDPGPNDATAVAPAPTSSLPDANDDLAARLFMPVAEIQKFVRLLRDRKQLVFYGPPGTGKTYIARKVAEYLAGGDNTDAVTLIQFHPSYAYEDFVEGFRPSQTDSGQATFRLTEGPLRRLAALARQPANSGRPFFLIIDEMNRGNLAKVFGELYFLLEYRVHSVSLQYSPAEAFSLPENLYIIGTMNTTDRSVGLVDAAIRRRFPFVELHPETSPVEGVLAAFLEANEFKPERAELLRAINKRIDTRDLRIGPSYFMRPEAQSEEGLQQIWDYDILPLLAEHFYGRKDAEAIAREFSLAAIRSALASAAEVPDGSDEVEA